MLYSLKEFAITRYILSSRTRPNLAKPTRIQHENVYDLIKCGAIDEVRIIQGRKSQFHLL